MVSGDFLLSAVIAVQHWGLNFNEWLYIFTIIVVPGWSPVVCRECFIFLFFYRSVLVFRIFIIICENWYL